MIKTLFIKNFVLIDELEVSFGEGLNVLTGETGAGKSILINALDVAFGNRGSKELIKTGESKAFIEVKAEYKNDKINNILLENGIELEEDNYLTVSREISTNASKSRINGSLVTQNFLQTLREILIDIHGQYETFKYLKPSTHLALLDAYGNNDHQNLLRTFSDIYFAHKKVKKELAEITELNKDKEKRLDFLKFQAEEIKSAEIDDINEYEKLNEERQILLNKEELKNTALNGYETLYNSENSIVDTLDRLTGSLDRAVKLDASLQEIRENLSDCSANLREAGERLRDYNEKLDCDGSILNDIEERLDLLDKIKRKYGPTISDAVKTREVILKELAEIEFTDEKVNSLTEELKELSKKLENAATELSQSRLSLAEVLSEKIENELLKLELPKANFKINISEKSEISQYGTDDAEFLISTNTGEPLKSLVKIASGGEISRVMLAVKTVFAKADDIDTVIFDEIDSGVSGRTSQAVAEELAELSLNRQIICITHQPIIAAMADKYFFITKNQSDCVTQISVEEKEGKEKVFALSNLASGSYQDIESVNFSDKLLRQSQEFKEGLKILV